MAISPNARTDIEEQIKRLTEQIFYLKGGIKTHHNDDAPGGPQEQWLGMLIRWREEAEQFLIQHTESA
jgi:hypothetical protein